MEHSESYYNMTCPMCGKKFHLKPYSVKRSDTHYCSKSCFYKSKSETFSGINNHQYGLKGNLNPTWSGGRTKKHGYWHIQVHGHPFGVGRESYVLEHRLVAEKYLLNEQNSVVIDGVKYLSPEYIVHHVNGIKTDNRPENLYVMKLGEHSRMHNKENDHNRNRDKLGRYI